MDMDSLSVAELLAPGCQGAGADVRTGRIFGCCCRNRPAVRAVRPTSVSAVRHRSEI